MRFTPREDFRHGAATFESGNSYESAKHGLSDDEVRYFHAAGWADVEGMDHAPTRDPSRVTLAPAGGRSGMTASEV